MRTLRFVIMASLLALASCGPDLASPGDDGEVQVPPPAELSSLPDDMGEVMASGVDPSASRPPPPPFDR